MISGASQKYAMIFQISKRGLRPDEISKITLRNLDFSRRQLNVRTSKQGLQRTIILREETLPEKASFRRGYSKNEHNFEIFGEVPDILRKRFEEKAKNISPYLIEIT